MSKQPEALRLADAIDPLVRQFAPDHLTSKVAAAELRRLHDLLGKSNALCRIRAERIKELERKLAEQPEEQVTKTGKAYVDSLIDALLLPLTAMTASDLEALHRRCAEMLLMYAAPEAPQPAKQPLIADEICDFWEFITGHQIQFGPSSEGRPMYLSTDEVIDFARAIERAHGIGGQK